jgi:hypothetical protein
LRAKLNCISKATLFCQFEKVVEDWNEFLFLTSLCRKMPTHCSILGVQIECLRLPSDVIKVYNFCSPTHICLYISIYLKNHFCLKFLFSAMPFTTIEYLFLAVWRSGQSFYLRNRRSRIESHHGVHFYRGATQQCNVSNEKCIVCVVNGEK